MNSEAKKTILLVEDEITTALIQIKKIKGLGYEVVNARTGEEALEIVIGNSDISLILMDIDLGKGISGPETAQQILLQYSIPIVFLTSHSERDMVEKVRGITRYGYIIKNSGDFVLQSSIEMAFELFGAHKDIETRMADLQASQNIVTMALEGTDQGIWEFDLLSKKITYDINLEKILGYKLDDIEFTFDWWKSQIEPGRYEAFEKSLSDYIEGKVKYLEWEYRIMDKSGNWQWIQAIGKFDKSDTTGYPTRLLGTHCNITEKKKLKELEKHREHAFQLIHEYSMELAYMKYEDIFPGLINHINILFNAKGALVSIYNETTQNLEVHYTTLSNDDNAIITKLLGKNMIGFKVPVDEDKYKMMTETVVGEAASLHELTFGAIPELISRPIEKIFGLGLFVPVVLLHKKRIVGTMVIVLRPDQSIPDREVLLAFAGITANALERRKAEDHLRESEARYQLLADHMYGTTWLMDMNFKTTYISPSITKIRGFTVEEIMELPLEKNITPESLKLAIKEFSQEKEKILSDPSYILDRTLEIEYYKKDGSTYWSENRFSLIRDENGKPMAILGEGRDITERKIAEEQIKESAEKYRFLTNNIPDIIYSLNGEGKIASINSTAFERYGHTEQSSMGRPFLEFIHPEDREILIKSFLNALEEKRKDTNGLQFRLVAENGSSHWFELNASARFDNNGSYLGEEGVLRDITDRKQAEQKIQNMIEEKELLLQEVYHRIKNNMNTIKGLLSLQISAEENPSIIESLQDAESRVQSMIFLYDRLNCSDNYRELSIRNYISSLTDEIIGSFPNRGKVKIRKKIDDFILNIQILSSIGIIVNEILTNTMKHAFVGRDSGLITISASQKNNHVVIIIQDNGAGLPETVSFENSTGFGMQLIGLLTEQIGGTIKIVRGDGTRFVLEFEI